MDTALERLTISLADRYRIERELGQGGMATVYLAHDVRHDRHVALKVLRPELAAILGGDRFLKEIRTTANLQHPHILALHDSGEADGLVYYVMPYIDGESLRDRLNREKQLPVDDAVRIAREVADALDYAHQHGVIHRDIKPENILLHGGHALVADFGIALAAARSDGGSRMTETGMSLGTPYYMAPEQAMGEKDITPRADIYALGCVLYEMLTAEPPFVGATAQAIIARVMTEEPRSLTLQRHTIPPSLEAAVRCALEKLPADRFPTAAAFGAALANPGFTGTRPAAVPAASRRNAWLARLAIPMTALAALLLVFVGWSWSRPRIAPRVIRYGFALPASQEAVPERRFALSPDGARFAYVGPGTGAASQIWIKEAGRFDATPLAGTANSVNFAFSPDGGWLAFAQGGLLKKLPIQGGAAITLADSVGGNSGLTWGDDGTIVFIGPRNTDLRRVIAAGGAATVVWHSDTGSVRFPVLLPGGRGLLFDRCNGGSCRSEHALWTLNLDTHEASRIQPGAALGVYARTGHIIYAREDGGMFALPFDPKSLRVLGPSVPVLDSIAVVNVTIPLFSLSDDGTLVVRSGTGIVSRPEYQMVWVDRSGHVSPVDTSWGVIRMTATGGNAGWALSPDGRRLAIGLATDAGDDIWIKQLPHGPVSRLTFDSSAEYRPRWSFDGRYLDYVRIDGGTSSLFRRLSDGTGKEDSVLRARMNIHEVARTRDNQWLLARTGGQVNTPGARDIYAMQAGDSTLRPLLASPSYDEAAIALSPDGHWIAYESDESGRTQVYVRPFPNVDGGKWQISVNGGAAPHWSANGRELFYVDGERNMMSAPVVPGTSFSVAERRTLFRLGDDLNQPQNDHYTTYEVAPDGRFLMARRQRADVAPSAPLIVAQNWFEELKQKLGRP